MKSEKTKKINIKEYSGNAYIGIDVHRLTYSVAIVIERTVVKKFKMTADGEQLIKSLKAELPKASLNSVYEAGFSGYELHRLLSKSGINNIMVNPASIQVASSNRVKTDKLDAIKLAHHLCLGLLNGIRIRTQKEEQVRLLSRTRKSLVQDRTRMMLRVRMKLLQFDLLPITYRQTLTLKQAKEFLSLPKATHEVVHSVKIFIRLWESIDKELKEIEKLYKARLASSTLVKKYKELPGIGINTAIVLADELGDCSQFANQKTLFSFLGLTPSEHSSGETVRKGGITHRGDPKLRAMLVEAAWVAIRHDSALKKSYSKIAARRGAQKAIVAIARKLIGRARAIVLNNTEYELNYNIINPQLKTN